MNPIPDWTYVDNFISSWSSPRVHLTDSSGFLPTDLFDTLQDYTFTDISEISDPREIPPLSTPALSLAEVDEVVRRMNAGEIPASSALYGKRITTMIQESGQTDSGSGYTYPFQMRIIDATGTSRVYPTKQGDDPNTEWARVLLVTDAPVSTSVWTFTGATLTNADGTTYTSIYSEDEIDLLADEYLAHEFGPLATGEALDVRMTAGPEGYSAAVPWSKHPLYIPWRTTGNIFDPSKYWYSCTAYVPLPYTNTMADYDTVTGLPNLVTYEVAKSTFTGDTGHYPEKYFPWSPQAMGGLSLHPDVAKRAHARMLYSLDFESGHGPDLTNGISANSILNQFVYIKPKDVPGFEYPETMMYGGYTNMSDDGNPRSIDGSTVEGALLQRLVRCFMNWEVDTAGLGGAVICDEPEEEAESWYIPCSFEVSVPTPVGAVPVGVNLRDPRTIPGYCWRGNWWWPLHGKTACEYWEDGYVLVKKSDMAHMGYGTYDSSTHVFTKAATMLTTEQRGRIKDISWDLLHPKHDPSIFDSYVTLDASGNFVSYDAASFAASAEGQALQTYVTAAQAGESHIADILGGNHSIKELESLAFTSNTSISNWMYDLNLHDGSNSATVIDIWNDLFTSQDNYPGVAPNERPALFSSASSDEVKAEKLAFIESALISGHPLRGVVHSYNATHGVRGPPTPATGQSATQPADEVFFYFEDDTSPHSYAEAKSRAETISLVGHSGATRLPTTVELQAFLHEWTTGTYTALYTGNDFWCACANPAASGFSADYVQIGTQFSARGTSYVDTYSPATDPANLVGTGWPNNATWASKYCYVAEESYSQVVDTDANTYSWTLSATRDSNGLGIRAEQTAANPSPGLG